MNHLLQWYNLIYELPALLAAILLTLSSVRVGHGSAHHGGHAQISHHTLPAHHAAAHNIHGGAQMHHGEPPAKGRQPFAAAHPTWRSAPVTALVGFFALFWGIGGYICNTIIIGTAVATIPLIAQSAVVALVVGLVAARGGAELLAKMMPRDETYDVSKEGLYGLTGEVVYEVTGLAGRVHIYDDHGTLHDETCRAAQQGAIIGKGCRARIVDKDQEGHLLVEEVF